MEREQVLAFRAARLGLAERGPRPLAEAAACPASDFQRGSALLALAARSDAVTREAFDRATDVGDVVVGPTLRAAIHAVAPSDFALYGRALLADDPEELMEQLGQPMKAELSKTSIGPQEALDEVTGASEAALREHGALDKNGLHEELRSRVRDELLPWCKGCKSHHVAPMLWRFALIKAGARCDSQRRYLLGDPGDSPEPGEAVRRFLGFYGPATANDFAAWTGVARGHARRLWREIDQELVEVKLDGRRTWLLERDVAELDSPPETRGLRLLPPRDPYLQQTDRATLVSDADLRKRVFRPVASPGAVLQDGSLAGLWRARARGKRLELEVERIGKIDRDALEAEADRVAQLRGSEAADLKGV
jgi:hypothetical protein